MTRSPSAWLITKQSHNPFSRDFWREKAKHPVFLKAAVTATSLLFFAVPLLAMANPFSWAALLDIFGQKASAEGISDTNSQRMALLDPEGVVGAAAASSADLPISNDSALAPESGPSGTAADIAEMPSSSQISAYIVRPGDTLSGIARMFEVSVNTIIWANDMQNHTIHPGDKLVILPVTGIQHAVVSGETLASLAKKYGGSPDEIAAFNGLALDAALENGQTVIIPNGEIQLAGNSSGTEKKSRIAGNPYRKKAIARAANNEPYLGGAGDQVDSFIWPVDGGEITQGLHGWNAVDIGAPRGTSIFAAAAGIVVVARDNGGWNGGYGNYVVISHPDGTQTLYAHMSQVLTSEGDSVRQGQTIGLVGASGEATGSHLHFEVRAAQNPFASLPLGSSE